MRCMFYHTGIGTVQTRYSTCSGSGEAENGRRTGLWLFSTCDAQDQYYMCGVAKKWHEQRFDQICFSCHRLKRDCWTFERIT